MRWEIYKQLKPIEREYYEKEIKTDKTVISDLFNFKYMILFAGLGVMMIILAAFLITNPITKDAGISLLNVAGGCFKIGIGFFIMEMVVATLLMVFDLGKENKWLRELGYTVERKK